MKHNWEKDENGNVNEWAWESGFHNGVFCVDCGKSVCVHCDPDYMELDDCTGPEPGIDAATALSTLQAENSQLRADLEYEREHANAYHEECGQWEAENEKLREKIEDARLEGYAKGLGEMSEENENLRAEVELLKKEHCAGCSVPVVEAGRLRDLNEAPKLRAELEQVTAERDAAVRQVALISQPNEPLTLEQLRQMDGRPVWIVEPPDWGHWELSADAEDYIADRDQDLYGLKHDDPAGQCGLHVLGWLAYRRPPEGENHHG